MSLYLGSTKIGGVGTFQQTGESISMQEKTVTPTKSTQTLSPDAGYTGLSSVTVNPIPSNYIEPTGTLSVTSNGTVDVTQYASASVNVPTSAAPSLQSKNATPIESAQTITPDSGYDGLSSVSVEAISSTYVGSGVTRQAAATITPTTSSQTAVASGVYTTGAVTVAAMPSGTMTSQGIIVGNDCSLTAEINVTPGYIYEGMTLVDGLSTVGSRTITPTSSSQTAVPAYKYTTGAITVAAVPTETQTFTSNGTYTPTAGSFFSSVTVDVAGDTFTTQTKSVTPSESAQTVTPDTGYDGLSSVEVGAISDTYVGSGIDQNDSTDLTASGATVTAPAGYYATAASKSVASGSASTPATSITANPSISVDANGLITATASASQSVAPTISAGYVSSGTAGTITVSGSNTSQLSTQAAATITPTESSQTAVAAGKYTTGAVTVGAIDSSYVGSGITRRTSSDVSTSAGGGDYIISVPSGYYASNVTKYLDALGATTYNTSTIDRTIASGVYLYGAQTIKAVTTSGLTASNIAAGVSVKVGDANDDDRIVGITGTYTSDATATATDIVSGATAYVNGSKVTGTLAIQHYYTGSSAPSSALGENGDLYFQTSS